MELEKGLLEIVSFLEDAAIPYMIIGGFANLAWGVPRTTQDVDITVQVRDRTSISVTLTASFMNWEKR